MNFFKPKFWDKNQASVFSIILFPISLIIKLLNLLKRSITKTYKFSIPIICVGNIYVGGTGKTPLCIEIFLILKTLNMNPAFVRKEYASFQDEANLQKQTGAVCQDTSRIKALNKVIQNKFNVAVLDDGFQDFSVNKNLSILCFNEKQWIGNGLVIPSGPLRESLSAIKRANCVFINGKRNIDIENKILSKNKNVKIFYTKYEAENISDFKNKKVTAFAGIGNPQNFFNLLEDSDINVVEEIEFPDHYKYSKKDLENLINKTNENSSVLVTTEKDYMRINQHYRKDINYLKIKGNINNKNQFIEEIKKIL